MQANSIQITIYRLVFLLTNTTVSNFITDSSNIRVSNNNKIYVTRFVIEITPG